MAVDETKPKRMGRPPILEQGEISLEDVIRIMLKEARQGAFFFELPAAIHEETSLMVSLSWLDSLEKHADFSRAKRTAFAYCVRYWRTELKMASIQTSAWIFIMKNVAGWRDAKDIKFNDETPPEKTDGKAALKRLKQMLDEEVG